MYDKDFYNSIEQKLELILSAPNISLSKIELSEIREYIDVTEYGIAFEYLCFVLCEKGLVILSQLYNVIEELGTQMELDIDVWHCLDQ